MRTYRRDGVGVADPVLSDGRATMVPGVSERTNGATKFSHLDRPGIIAKTTDVSGTVVDSRRYDAFGLPISVTNPTNSQKGFASAFGIQEDSETGLKLMGHRYYDSGSGRFITRDRAGAGTNWYAYCDNNPLKAVDPDGDKPVFVGGSIWDRLAIILALENIARLPGGAWANEVLRGNRNYEITIVQKGGSKGSPYLPEISIDINDLNNYQYMTKNGGYEYFSWEQIVGHEFGHVFGHLTGSAPRRGDSNQGLGEPDRRSSRPVSA